MIKIVYMFFAVVLMPVFLYGCGNKTAENSDQKQEETLVIGKEAPDFTLSDQHGTPHTLSQYRGKNVVLYFYPKDDTPGCTKEACSFRDDHTLFSDLNTTIIGVSVDDPESHKKFIEKYDLNFTLLADVDKRVSKSYGAFNMIGISKRQTFLIDKDGIIRQIYRKVDVSNHSQEIADFIREKMM